MTPVPQTPTVLIADAMVDDSGKDYYLMKDVLLYDCRNRRLMPDDRIYHLCSIWSSFHTKLLQISLEKPSAHSLLILLRTAEP